jgi:oxidase EvaA
MDILNQIELKKPSPAPCDHLPARIREAFDDARNGFSVRRVEITPGCGWKLEKGGLVHVSGGFFSVVGCRFSNTPLCSAVLLYQPQSAIAGLLGRVGSRGLELMLQARVEPGLVGMVQLAPTIQSTAANYLRLHGGKATPFIDYFTGLRPDARIHHESSQLDLGDRYLMKTKRCSVIETSECPEPAGNCFWVSSDELAPVIGRDYVLGMDMRSALSLLPWSDRPGGFALVPACEAVRRSLTEPLREIVLGPLLARLAGASSFAGFIALQDLENWTLDAMGLREISAVQGFSVEFFETRATSREVSAWVQPLVVTPDLGRVVLLLRNSKGRAEVFVRVRKEIGHARGRCLSASFVESTAKDPSNEEWAVDLGGARVLLRTLDCAEGGRFFQQSSSFEILEGDFPGDPSDGAWVSVAELKYLLSLSDVCSIELRAVASLLLALEDSCF